MLVGKGADYLAQFSQILDEFQFLDTFIYADLESEKPLSLTGSYQFTGSRRVSPQIITGAYVGWLSRILGKMTDRYREYYLKSLGEEEALSAVYNYARFFGQEISDESAAWMAEVCDRDPYIACMFESDYKSKDLNTIQGVNAVLDYETCYPAARLAKLWFEYLHDVIYRVNDLNGKRIVLYLAQYGDEERTRPQIMQDLGLDLSDWELEQRLQKLVAADIPARGSSSWAYKGLGDPIFEMVFRKAYEPEIKNVDVGVVREKIETKLHDLWVRVKAERARISHHKGETAENKMRYKVAMAGQKKLALNNLVHGNPFPDMTLGFFETVEKTTVRPDGETAIEIDLYAKSGDESSRDLVIEVKDRSRPVTRDVVEVFISKKKLLEGYFPENTGFLFYSERPPSGRLRNLLGEGRDHGSG